MSHSGRRPATGARRIGALLLGLLLGLSILASAGAQPALDGEGFDHYTLALTWHPGFCESRRDPPRECREPRLRGSADDGFVLHGLWPSLPERFAEDGVTPRRWWAEGCFLEQPRARGSFCRAHRPFKLPEALAGALDAAMPGRASCLDRYQYAKHAACLNLPAEAYFATAVDLVAAINASAFGDFVVINQGGSVARNALIAAFEAAFGEATGRALQLVCSGRGNRLLSEVRIGIAADALASFPASSSLVPLRRGRCASRIHIARLAAAQPANERSLQTRPGT
ncbi:ribonuclease I [Halomonas sp. HP20-15]|uniref:ribonuclease T2 family protein n=1 Tax=Halomonas sp. HP20-15 TaxID=3085901 RepID=UPI002981D03F|nr:ribonuclease I [Halomonas sp. HP20-15]MDW5378483.1 ribonuclease I [Halomonas sp. HP20-15]